MPVCEYFIGNTFAHLFGGLAVTAISSENALVQDLPAKPYTAVALLLAIFVILFLLLVLDVGFSKYVVFTVFCLLMGQLLSGFVKQLEAANVLSKTLIIVGAIFVAMMFVGFADKGNMLPFGTYLFAGLLALVVSMIFTSFFIKDEKEASAFKLWFSRIIVVLFTLYLAYDVQVLREHAKLCRVNPDYIQESLGLYLDLINLFEGVGTLEK